MNKNTHNGLEAKIKENIDINLFPLITMANNT